MQDGLATTLADDILILGADDVVWGTAMLGTEFGTIKRAMVRRTGDREMLMNQKGELKLLLIKNPGFELILEVAFHKDVEAPGLLETLSLPLVGVQGHVMEGVTVAWELGDERGMTIPVNAWDVMQDARAYRLLPGSGALVEINPAPPLLAATASTTALTIQLTWPAFSGATGYTLQAGQDGSTWTTLATTSALAFAHTGLTAGQAWFYRLRATLAAGFSPWSTVVTAAPLAPLTVAPAFTLQERSATEGPVLTGARVPGAAPFASLSSTTGYQVQVATSALMTGGVVRDVLPAELTPNGWVTNPGPYQADVLYYFRVRAYNFHGHGPWSPVQSARSWPLQPRPPGLGAGMLQITGPVVHWFDPGGSRTGFRLALVSTADGSEVLLASLPAGQTTFNLRATLPPLPAGEWVLNVWASRGTVLGEPFNRLLLLPIPAASIVRADNTTTSVDSTRWTADDFA